MSLSSKGLRIGGYASGIMSLSAGFEFPKAVNQSESDIPDTGPFLHPRLHDGIVVADPGNAGLFQTCVLGE